jgi:aspartate racemase
MTGRKTLGVLGGMGPAATAEFLRLLADAVPATSDQHHPRLVMLSDPEIPDRTVAILENRYDTMKRIRSDLLTLVSWGADLLAVPCNTAHVFIQDREPDLPVPLVDIVNASLDEAIRVSPDGSWLAASTGTVVSGLYQLRAEGLGYHVAVPDGAVQAAIHETSLLVKANQVNSAGKRFAEVAAALWERRRLPLLAACTELPIAFAATGLPEVRMISSLAALARHCVEELYGELMDHEHTGGGIGVHIGDRVLAGGDNSTCRAE